LIKWGQQASIPTFHQSDILYFNRYRDCGDGVLEFTSVIHNAAADLENGDDLTYLNVPWGGKTVVEIYKMYDANSAVSC